MLKTWKWWWLGLLAIMILAAVLRLTMFPLIPRGLNRDEAALGYNAFSLLKTGRDEFGIAWPISITSFGDQKLPGYVYLLIPFISVLGLHDWVIRLPSMIAGFFVIIGAGVVALQFAQSLRLSKSHAIAASVVTMLLVAVSPWSVHFSRVAYEANVALAYFVWGLALYQWAIDRKTIVEQRAMLVGTAVLWSMTLLTYHSYHIFLPLFLLGLLVLELPKIKKLDKIGVAISVAIGLVTVGLLFRGGVFQANLIKNRGISPFHAEALWQAVTVYRSALPPQLALFGKLLFNPLTEAITVFTQNLITMISGIFFFIHGSGHGDNNPGNMSNLPLYIAPLCIAWLVGLWKRRESIGVKRFFLWVLAGMIPAALTIQPQHEVRLEQLFLAIEIGSGLGALLIWNELKKPWVRTVALALFAICVLTSTIRFAMNYLLIIPQQVEANERYPLLAAALAKYKATGDQVVTQSPENSPYIWYLEENAIDPVWLQSHIVRYPPSDEGFLHVKQIDNLYFEKINWDDLYARAKQKPVIVIVRPEEMPGDQRASIHANFLEEIKNHNGQVLYQIWMLDPNKAFDHKLQPSS
ncbi:MAG TPA: hypothetical protein VFG51_03880 [Candidatus Saccharimonadia bacterium]|nr:hypothetical protein [Candidatus Saccharimonadia bacterium]